jgi:hypothetical protein
MTDQTTAPQIDRANWLSIGEVAARYDITAARLYTMIRTGKIPADYITREKSKGRQGFRHLINASYANIFTPRVTTPAADVAAV